MCYYIVIAVLVDVGPNVLSTICNSNICSSLVLLSVTALVFFFVVLLVFLASLTHLS